MPAHISILGVVGIGALVLAAAHLLLTFTATLRWRLVRRSPGAQPPAPPITVLKPLCGAEAGLYDNLRSFFMQRNPRYQIVFGVRDENDAALQVVDRLIKEFPAAEVCVVASNRQHGGNRKVSNLINMAAHARYDILVLSDSDVRVGPDYLDTVAAPLCDSRVGLVTCIYRDVPTDALWSRLGALYINDWYIPSVLLAWMFGHRGFVSGQTICVHKETLRAIGGLSSLANHLADDYTLGQRIRATGKRVVLSNYLPHIVRHEPTYADLLTHELRWMQTIRVLKPTGFRMLFLSFSLPLAVIGLLLSAPTHAASARALFAAVLTLRLAQHFFSARTDDSPALAEPWLIPMRDVLLCYCWYKSLLESRVSWRGAEYRVGTDGIMRASHETS